MKTAVDDLKIVDVDRKPEVLFDALQDEKLARDAPGSRRAAAVRLLRDRGAGPQKLKVFATNGGLSVSMKDGVQYELYFGDPKSAEKGDSSKLNRYLMVTAEVDESMIPMPKLEPEDEPLGPESTDKPEDAKPEDAKPKRRKTKTTHRRKPTKPPQGAGRDEKDDEAEAGVRRR